MKSLRVLFFGLLFCLTPLCSAYAQNTEDIVRISFATTPVLIKIAQCESQFRQFDEHGQPLYNQEGSSAVGVMQIMSSIHKRSARRLGMNLYTLEGNLAYARHLYKKKGTRPWRASSSCWRHHS